MTIELSQRQQIMTHVEGLIPEDITQEKREQIKQTLSVIDVDFIEAVGSGGARRIAEIIVRGSCGI